MKIISDISLKDFGFWSGGRDTADDLTNEQLDRVEAELETLYPEGMTDTELNDMFWFDRETIYQMAGCYPKFYAIKAPCGLVKHVKANDEKDVEYIENTSMDYDEEEELDYEIYEDVSDIDIDEFEETRFFKVWSRIGNYGKVLYCIGNDAADDLKQAFELCKVEEIGEVPADGIDGAEDWEDYDGCDRLIDEFIYDEDEMYNRYDIPVYAIPRICKLVLNPNGALDYYDIPESHAINEYNRYLELSDEDVKNIDGFVADLHKAMPDGFTIDWDAESVGSPYFERRPAFGLAMDCVKLRVYPKVKEDVNN